ncbi:MAG: acyl-CoA dehydrogenase family protein [Proteobacteria bacterium]|nr:acyl-CoA dehydrogenase family protein [Pseudomonadota bacterium]MBU2518409.1 acyl-CoA dehydrogenase family protein [Pseudomonadota bacterium]
MAATQFDLNEDQRIFMDMMKDFAEQKIEPLVENAETMRETPREVFTMMGEMGFLCPRYPEEMGGGGGDKIIECIMIEQLATVCAGICSAVVAHSGLGTMPIYLHGSDEQKQRFLLPAIKGEKIAAFGLTEPNVGSDTASIQTKAVRDGDNYIINGSKMFITNAPICDYVIVAAYTQPEKRGLGINLFIVERGTEGFTVSRKLEKVGTHSAETGELVFEDCVVPAENLLGGKECGGFQQLEDTLISGRITYGARCLGTAQAAFNLTAEYAKQRIQFGKPIGKFQFNSFRLAEMATLIDIMRSYTWRVARLYDQGVNVKMESSMVKLFCAENLQKITNQSMQMYGGYGYMPEFAIERHWRDGRLCTVTEGTSEVQRMVIARELGI